MAVQEEPQDQELVDADIEALAGDQPDEEAEDPPTAGTAPAAPPNRTGGTVSVVVSLLVVVVIAVFALVSLLAAWGATNGSKVEDRWQALFFAATCMFIGLGLLHLLGSVKVDDSRRWGMFRPLIGDEGRLSTSLTQLGLWTVVIGTGLAYLLGLTIFDKGTLVTTVLPESVWEDYLILLGGPFAAAVLTKGITTYKVENGVLQRTEPVKAEVKQLAQDANGQTDLVDSQYLLFNVIAMAYVVVNLVEKSVLPTIPGVLLSLTGGTAALYVANKAAARNAPTITSVSPLSVRGGKTLTIYGTNFDPADPTNTKRRITVTIGGHDQPLYSDRSSDTMVEVRVPKNVPAGNRRVKVTSTAGVQTTARVVNVLPAKKKSAAVRQPADADVAKKAVGKKAVAKKAPGRAPMAG